MARSNLSAHIRVGASVDRSVGSAFRQVERQSAGIGQAVRNNTRDQVRQAGGAIQSGLQGQLISTVAPALAFGEPLRKAIRFESVLADIGKVVDFKAPDGLKKMGQDILRLSTDKGIPLAADQIGDIVAAAGQAGIKRHELLRFTEDAAKIGVAFDLTGKQAGAAMSGLRSIFGLAQQDAVLVADSFNHLSNNMDATARDILRVTNRTGSTAKLFGLTGQQVGALGATFLALKSPPEVAATGINALLQKLATADKQNSSFQDGLAAIGFSAKQLKRDVQRDAQGTLLRFLEAVKGSKDQLGTLADLFGAEYADDIAKLVGSLDMYKEALGLVEDQTQFAGSATKEFQVRSKTTENALQLLSNQANRLAITVGNTMLPALNVMIGTLSKGIARVSKFAERNEGLVRIVFAITGALVAYQTAAFAASLGTMVFGNSVLALTAVLSPFGLAIGAVVAAGFLLVRNWQTIKTFFLGFGAGVKTGLGPTFDTLVTTVEPVVNLLRRASRALDRFTSPAQTTEASLNRARSAGERFGLMLGQLVNRIHSGIGAVGALAISLTGTPFFRSGRALVTTFAQGIRSGARVVVAVFARVLRTIRDYLPFSDARIGPLSQLTASGRAIITTIAAGIRQAASRLLRPLRPILERVANWMGPVWTQRIRLAVSALTPVLSPLLALFQRLRPVLVRVAPVVGNVLVRGFRILGVVLKPLFTLLHMVGSTLSFLGHSLGFAAGGIHLLAVLFTPLGLKLLLVAGAIGLLVRFRSQVRAFFQGFKEGFTQAFGPALARFAPVMRQVFAFIDSLGFKFGKSEDMFRRLGRVVGLVVGHISAGLTDLMGWMLRGTTEIGEFARAFGKTFSARLVSVITFARSAFASFGRVIRTVLGFFVGDGEAISVAARAGQFFGQVFALFLPITLAWVFGLRRMVPLMGFAASGITHMGRAAGRAIPKLTALVGRMRAAHAQGPLWQQASGGLGGKLLSIGSKLKGVLTTITTLSFTGVITGIKSMTVALLTNPIGLILTGIAFAGLLIYRYWQPIKAFFAGLWQGIKSVLAPAKEGLVTAFAPIGEALQPVISAFGWVWKQVKKVVEWLTGLAQPAEFSKETLDSVGGAGRRLGEILGGLIKLVLQPLTSVIQLIGKIGGGVIRAFGKVKTTFGEMKAWLSNFNLFSSGKKMLGTLTSGIKAAGKHAVGSVRGIFGKIRKLLPHSDAPEGPLSTLTASGRALVTTFARGIAGTAGSVLATPLRRQLTTITAGLGLAIPVGTPAEPGRQGAELVERLRQRAPLSVNPNPVARQAPEIHVTISVGDMHFNIGAGHDPSAVAETINQQVRDIMSRAGQLAGVQIRGALHDGDADGLGAI